MKTSEILRKAVELIDTPEKWCQGTRLDALTGQMCMVGAYCKVKYGDARYSKYDPTENIKLSFGCHDSVWPFNDSRLTTHEDVLTAYALAIVVAEDRGD